MKLTKRIIHIAFEYGLLIKGINGIIEIIGGIILLTVNIHTIQHFLVWLSLLELPHGHNDFLAHGLTDLATHFSADTKLVGGIYLLTHGIFKIILVGGLQMKKRWAYPVGIGFLMLFISYQVYRLTLHFSYALLVLTALDSILMVLIYREYKGQKNNLT